MRVWVVGAFLAIGVSWPAAACILVPPWVPKLPNETAEQYAERRDQAYDDREAVWEFNRQQALVEKASDAFLAEVVASTVTSEGHNVATVKPVLVVKGTLPDQLVRLETYSLPGCVPHPAIDGEGALAKKGDLVFAFTGLEPHAEFRPRGIDSLKTGRILSETLVEILKAYGLEEADE
ncbi:MAG: hypothetical protein ACR2JJ_01555 [Sphingomicrobium sp.]